MSKINLINIGLIILLLLTSLSILPQPILAQTQLPDLTIIDAWQIGGQIHYVIKNNGPGNISGVGAPVSFYNALFVDGNLVAQDHLTSPLAAGQQLERIFNYQYQATPPSNIIRIIADYQQNIQEGNEQNNIWEDVWQEAENLPDLIVDKLDVGEGNMLSVTVKNIGTGPLPAGWIALGQIWINGQDKGTFNLQNPTDEIYGGIAVSGGSAIYLLPWDIAEPTQVACGVDTTNSIKEANEQNNYKEEKVIPPVIELPDLVVTDMNYSQATGSLGCAINNVGEGDVSTSFICSLSISEPFVYLKSEVQATLKSGETFILYFNLPTLSLGPKVTVQVCADISNQVMESNEQNNCLEKVLVIEEKLPDLVIEEIKCDPENREIGYVIKNTGQAVAAPGHLTMLLMDGKEICKDAVDLELEPGQSQISWFDCNEWPGDQNIEVKVCADYFEQVNESNEQNNCLIGSCVSVLTPAPAACPEECECLLKEEGYAKGLEFCLDENGNPIICEVVDSEKGIYKYCFKVKKEAPKPQTKPVYPKRDVNGDDLVDDDDVAIIVAHYGGKTGKSLVPWDTNNDGDVDYKDLAIVGAKLGKSITTEKLEMEGITTPRQLLARVVSATAFQQLSLETDIPAERLIQAVLSADLANAIPGIDESDIHLLEGLKIGSLPGLQSIPTEDPQVMNMLHNELRLEWIASGGKERGEPLPTLDDLSRWATDARRITPTVQISEEALTFTDGSSIELGEDVESGEEETRSRQIPVTGSGFSINRGTTTEVFTVDYPGMGTGAITEGITPTIPPSRVPEPCPHIEGYINGFPYDINTLKIQAERIELRMQFDPLTRKATGFRPTVMEGKLVDVLQANVGPHGSPITYYSTGCLTPGKWKLTPIFYAEEPETVVWRGSWSPAYQEIEVTSGLESPSDVSFSFIPIETIRPTINITHTPEEPFGSDRVIYTVSIEDDHMLQKVEIYEWGRYADGASSEPELVASYFWDHGFPRERSYHIERGPYPSSGPSEIHFEVAAWDYAGNPQSRSEILSVTHITLAPSFSGVTGVPVTDYYIASIGEIVFSKDSDSYPPEGEMHCSSYTTLIKPDGSTTEMVQEYPYYKWVEAYRREGTPVCWPWMPVLAMRQSYLNSYDGYTLSTSVYENDSAFERFLRGLLHVLTGFVSLAVDAVRCVVGLVSSGDTSSCTSLMCEVLGQVNVAGSNIGDVEDDYMGTASFMTTREAVYGLEGGIDQADYSAAGSADGWRNDWNGVTTEGSVVEGACSQLASGTILNSLQQGVSWLFGGGGESWIKVLNHVQVYETKPVDDIKVKFIGAKVINDRDGSLRGAGDILARTLVGTIGGISADANDHSLGGEDLDQLPYSAADTYKFGCGDVKSGHSFTKNKFVFEHTFTDPNLAMLYVQIALWDDDGAFAADNEVGVLSIAWPMTRIMDIIEHPDEATRYGEALNVTVVHAVETYEGEVVYAEGMPADPTQEYYYIISDTREVWTRCEYREGESGFWGYPGAQITYEMWVKPYG